jgi:RIO-like serine/threonine protein kinase
MERVLTELDKTILLSFFIIVKGTDKYIPKDTVVLRFPVRRRKPVRSHIKKLEKSKLLSKHTTKDNYRLTKKGLKQALKLLHEGAKIV